jgi:hypothetical protein
MLQLSCSGGRQQDRYRPGSGKQSIATIISGRAGFMGSDLPISRPLKMYIKVRSRGRERKVTTVLMITDFSRTTYWSVKLCSADVENSTCAESSENQRSKISNDEVFDTKLLHDHDLIIHNALHKALNDNQISAINLLLTTIGTGATKKTDFVTSDRGSGTQAVVTFPGHKESAKAKGC